MLLRSQKTSAELENIFVTRSGTLENEETRNDNLAQNANPVISGATIPADVLSDETRNVRSSLQEGGSCAAGIDVTNAMNAAATAAQPTSMLNRIGNGGGDYVRNDLNLNQGMSVQGEVSSLNRSTVNEAQRDNP